MLRRLLLLFLPRRSSTSSSRSRLAAVFLLPAVVLLLLSTTSLRRPADAPPDHLLMHPYFRYDLDVLEPRAKVEGQRCRLPRLHPFHPSLWAYLSPPRPIVCSARRPELMRVDGDGRLRFDESQLHDSGYEVGKSLKCHWSEVKRGGTASGNVDDTISYGEESPIPKEGLQLPSNVEVLRTVCRNFAGIAVYDRLHAHVRNVREVPVAASGSNNSVNVLIFGLDSMSRLGFIRHLPLTYRYLTEELGMTVLRGMNKVGDNTYPNLVALLTGKAAYGGDLPDASSGYDDWPLIWRNFSRLGYATLWAEDFPEFGLFNYLATGFRDPPTLHYLRPFWLALKESPLLRISSHMCYGSTPRHNLQVDYVRQFVSRYRERGVPFFGFSFLAELSHEYMSRVSAADVHFRDFLQWLKDEGHLRDTLFMFMSDHGHRFDRIRTTQVGHIEERLPFFAVRFPETLSSGHPHILDNLRTNSGRLVTPFDVHATLADLLEFATTGRDPGVWSLPPSSSLGLSLFAPVPSNRTCRDAHVPAHYCACETATDLSVSNVRAIVAARAAVDRVNRMLAEAGLADSCRPLVLSRVTSAQLVAMTESDDGEEGSGEKVRVTLEVEPSGALLEATAVVSRDGATEMWGDVSRINPYAGQSDCIRHVELRKFCYCHGSTENATAVRL